MNCGRIRGVWVSKTLYFVLKRASLSLPSLICTICPPKVSEPELGQSQQQEIGPLSNSGQPIKTTMTS